MTVNVGDLLVHVDAIGHTSHLLLELAGEREFAADFQRDLEQIRNVSKTLYVFIKNQFPLDGTPITEQRAARLRHDAKNQLSQIDALCQFLLEAQEESSGAEDDTMWESFVDDFQTIRRYVESCRVAIDSLRGVNGQAAPAILERRALVSATTPSLLREAEPGKVLVADDNFLNRDLLRRFLELHHHQVVLAADGLEAINRLREEDFDLVLLDMLMPELNGFQVLDEMGAMGKIKYTPVIVVSGLNSTPAIVECLAKGAEDFLTRPIDLDILKARVNACLEKKRLRERELQQFFPEDVARQYLSNPEALSEGRRADVTVLFCDIQGFSTISERLGATGTIRWLSEVMNFLSHCVLEHEGVLVDYTGDELLAMWGAPTEQPHHAELACRAAHAMLRGLPDVDRAWREEVGGETAVGIGLNSGEAFVGNIGTRRKFKYGPLGNTVNLGSRVQGATRYFRAPLLMTGETHRRLADPCLSRRLSQVRVRNIHNPVELYELAAPCHEEAAWRRLCEDYQQALAAFEGRNFRLAASILGNLLLSFPNDGPSLLLMSRTVNAMLDNGDGFDPVWTLPGK